MPVFSRHRQQLIVLKTLTLPTVRAIPQSPEKGPHHFFHFIYKLGYLGYSAAMLFMVIEHFTDVAAVSERFHAKGRMLPEGVTYQASWMDTSGHRCFQLMEAQTEKSLRPWLTDWQDLVEFEIVPVITSAEFWSAR